MCSEYSTRRRGYDDHRASSHRLRTPLCILLQRPLLPPALVMTFSTSASTPPPSPLRRSRFSSGSRSHSPSLKELAAMPLKSMADVANIIVRLRRHRKRAAQGHICSSSGDEPYTDARFRDQGALSAKRVPVEREYTFVCRDGVDTVKLVRLARGLLYEETVLIGANVLVEEQCVHFHLCLLWARVGLIRCTPQVEMPCMRPAAGRQDVQGSCACGSSYARRRRGLLTVFISLGPLLCGRCAIRAARSPATSIGRTRTRRARAHDYPRPARLVTPRRTSHR